MALEEWLEKLSEAKPWRAEMLALLEHLGFIDGKSRVFKEGYSLMLPACWVLRIPSEATQSFLASGFCL